MSMSSEPVLVRVDGDRGHGELMGSPEDSNGDLLGRFEREGKTRSVCEMDESWNPNSRAKGREKRKETKEMERTPRLATY